MLRSPQFAALVLFLSAVASATVPISGNIKTLAGVNGTSTNYSATLSLQYCDSNDATIIGTSLAAERSVPVTIANDGSFSITIYGNNEIACEDQVDVTQWTFSIYKKGQSTPTFSKTYILNAPGPINLNSQPAATAPPSVDTQGKAQVNNYIDWQIRTAPANPKPNFLREYAKTGGVICYRDAVGTEICPATGGGGAGALLAANNLSDLFNAATARTNLGLGTAATQNSNAFEVPLTFNSPLSRSTNTITCPTCITSLPSIFNQTIQSAAVDLAQRLKLNFQNGITCSDNGGSSRTDCQPNYGASANTVAQGNDSRITGAEQTANKNQANGYAGLDGSSKLNGAQQVYGTTANTAAQGNDSRITGAVQSSRAINTTAPLTGGGDLSTDRTIAISDCVASGASHARGAVPDPGASAGTTKFLREDCTWSTPAGAGTVTSVGLTLPGDLSTSPASITTSGTFAVTRTSETVSFSATPTFNCKAFESLTLAGNVTSSTLTGCSTISQFIIFEFIQDATGGRTVVWPTNVLGGGAPDTTANKKSYQMFVWNTGSSKAIAVTPMMTDTGDGIVPGYLKSAASGATNFTSISDPGSPASGDFWYNSPSFKYYDGSAIRVFFSSGTKADLLDTAFFCADAGASDAYACNLAPAITAYVTGTHYRFKANTANIGVATIALNGLSAITIKKAAGGITTDLVDNDIRAGQWVDIVYDGTNMQMQSTLGNAGGSGGTPCTTTALSVQYNNAGTFGCVSQFTYNGNTLTYTASSNSVSGFVVKSSPARSNGYDFSIQSPAGADVVFYDSSAGALGCNTRCLFYNVNALELVGGVTQFIKGDSTAGSMLGFKGGNTTAKPVWQDSAGNLTAPLSFTMDVNTTAVTVNTNTTSAQNLQSYSVPANTLNIVKRSFRRRGSGVYTTQAAQTPTITIASKIGSVTYISWTTAATTASATNMPWNYDVICSTVTAGASGTLECHGTLQITLGTTPGGAATVYNDTITAVSSTFDQTVANTIQDTITFSTNAVTANTASERHSVTEGLN